MNEHARQRFTSVDHSWLRMDSPTNLMTITGVLFFDAPLDRERLRKVIEARFLPIRRFRQQVERRRMGKPHWVDDPSFDLDAHLESVTLPAPADENALQELVGRLMAEPLDPDRPQWGFWLIDDYQEGSALVVRLHHAIGDGIALMLVLLALTDLEAEAHPSGESANGGNPLAEIFRPGGGVDEAALEHARRIMPEAMKIVVRPHGKGGGKGSGKRGPARLLARAAADLTRLTFRSSDPKTAFKGRLGVPKSVSWSAPVPLEDVKSIRSSLGGTVNDVLLSAMTGGLRSYLLARGEPGRDFRAVVPVSLRPLHKLSQLGNHFGLVFLSLPVGIADPVARMAELKRRMDSLKGSLEAGVVLGLLNAVGHAPRLVHRLLLKIFGTKATAVMTSVPGPRQPLYLAGQEIRDMLYWVPQSGGLGMGVSICSYRGRVRLGVATDSGLVPDPGAIVRGFHDELDTMLERAAKAEP